MAIDIVHIVGARPQIVKYFPVQEALRREGLLERSALVHTGQHYDFKMSEIFFQELGIAPPDFHLGVGSAPHGVQTAAMLQKIEPLLLELKPRLVVVYGDTNSTLAGALGASKAATPVLHVEAGLRSFDKSMPEEINRVVTDHLSTVLACPTETAIVNLRREGFPHALHNGKLFPLKAPFRFSRTGISAPTVVNIGDIMYDLLLAVGETARARSRILAKYALKKKEYFLLTLHRAENCDRPQMLSRLLRFVKSVAGKTRVIFPLHPRTACSLKEFRIMIPKGIEICKPLSYFDTVTLLTNAAMLLTDSGGLQKEAFWLKVPCVTLRDQTEWIETVESGWNILYKDFTGDFGKSKNRTKEPFGDGQAATRIARCIRSFVQDK